MLKKILQFFKKSEKVIIDRSHIKATPERNFYHPVFVLLFTLAVIASMWQYCHAGMTILILSLILPLAALCYVPYRYIGFTFRFLVQVFVFTAVTAWCFYAVKKGLISDKISLVVLGCTGVSFLMGRRKRDYGYLFVISTLLMIYGALLGRLLYLYLFTGYFLGCIIIFYGNRLINISGEFELEKPEKKGRPVIVFPYAVHIFLTFFFALSVFFLLPKLPTETKGFVEVSFHTEKESFASEDLQKWLSRKDTKKIYDPKGPFISDGKFADVISKNAVNEANIKNVPGTKDGNGAGNMDGGTPGQDLLFSVSSPLKLYHIGRIYNIYDGKKWQLSKKLIRRKAPSPSSSQVMPLYTDVEVRYYVEKFLSPTLFAPYYPVDFSLSSWKSQSMGQDIFGAKLSPRQNVDLPFLYKVNVRLYQFDKMPPSAVSKGDKGKKGAKGKKEKKLLRFLEPGSVRDYLSLPKKKISKRLRKFTGDLVRDRKESYTRALIIRDHLRNNYPYKQFPGKVPPGKESVDYFIFELKEGHCEYFASAMVIMSRIAGIPSRLVTGYSPGNYNTLINRFEVFEYHAHAWAQLYFPEHGWLTFDATPQGHVISRTTPAGIGSLRDPFGDDWRITPPELASSNRAYVTRKIEEAIREQEKKREEIENAMTKLLQREELVQEKKKPGIIHKKKLKKAPLSLKEKVRRLFRDWRRGCLKFLKSLPGQFRKYAGEIIFITLGLLFTGFLLFGGVRLLKRVLMMGKMNRCFARADDPDLDPGERIRSLYFAVRIMLVLAGYPRKNNMELLAYAGEIGKIDPAAGEALQRLFVVFYHQEYGGREPGEILAESLVFEIQQIREVFQQKAGKGVF